MNEADTYTLDRAEVRAMVWKLARVAAQLSAAVDLLERQIAAAERDAARKAEHVPA